MWEPWITQDTSYCDQRKSGIITQGNCFQSLWNRTTVIFQWIITEIHVCWIERKNDLKFRETENLKFSKFRWSPSIAKLLSLQHWAIWQTNHNVRIANQKAFLTSKYRHLPYRILYRQTFHFILSSNITSRRALEKTTIYCLCHWMHCKCHK